MNRNDLWLLPLLLLSFISCRSVIETKKDHCACAVSKEITVSNMSIDAVAKEIRYSLPQDGVVRIRAGIKDGPLLVNIVDWQERKKGKHGEPWDWKDGHGGIDFSDRKDISFFINALTNTTFHQSPGAHFSFPGSKGKDKQGREVIAGRAPIRVHIDDKDKRWLLEDKYEIVFFIDGVFLLKEEEGVDPFTYRLDTTNISNGPHLITVNVMAYHGEIGVFNEMILISNEER